VAVADRHFTPATIGSVIMSFTAGEPGLADGTATSAI